VTPLLRFSVLKPVRGLDPNAYENFAAFGRQELSEFEILFAVSDAPIPRYQWCRN